MEVEREGVEVRSGEMKREVDRADVPRDNGADGVKAATGDREGMAELKK